MTRNKNANAGQERRLFLSLPRRVNAGQEHLTQAPSFTPEQGVLDGNARLGRVM